MDTAEADRGAIAYDLNSGAVADVAAFTGGAFAGVGSGMARAGAWPSMAGMPGLDWMAGGVAGRQSTPMPQVPMPGGTLPMTETYNGHHANAFGATPMPLVASGADGFKDSPAYVTQTSVQPQLRYFNDADAGGGVSSSSLAGDYGLGTNEQNGSNGTPPTVCLPQPSFTADGGRESTTTASLNDSLTTGWDPSSFTGSFTVDQKNDVWQVKNTFLTISPQVKPIRSVRTAEGALCTLGASGVEID